MNISNANEVITSIPEEVCLWELDRRTRKIKVDENYQIVVGDKTSDTIILDEFIQLFSNDEAKRIATLVTGVIQNQGMEQTHTVVNSKTAGKRLVELTLWLSPEFEHMVQGTLQLITQIPDLASLSSLVFDYFEQGNFNILITDAHTNIVYSNEHANQTFGYQSHELLGCKARIFNANKHDAAFFEKLWLDINNKGYWSGKILSRHKNGGIFPFDTEIHQVRCSKTKQPYYISVSRNISGATHRLAGRNIGGVDLETFLPVQETLIENIAQLILNKEPKRTVIAVAFAPLIKGDSELLSVLNQAFQDLMPDYRKGYCGEQRYVVAFRCRADLATILARIKELITFLRRLSQQRMSAAIADGKIGISVLARDAHNAHDLVEHALLAILEGHASNGSNICFYDDNIHYELSRKDGLPNYLEQSLNQKAIEPWYQAIVSTRTWKIVKFEALCRFNLPSEHGYGIEELIATAERNNRVTELDDLICEKALVDLPIIQKTLDDSSIGLTLNRSLCNDVSGASLPKALQLVLKSEIEKQRITLEITESAYFEGNNEQLAQLELLREHGLSIAIDDFGTGYSSFSYLYQSHFDLLKIDQSFVRNLEKGTNAYFIVEMIVLLSDKLGIEVIAEGVETLNEAKLLYDLGVDYLQGFYFSKPLPISEIRKAKSYYKNIDLLSGIHSREDHQKLTSFCNSRHPAVSIDSTYKDVYDIFACSDYRIIVVLSDEKCVGIVERDSFGYSISPTTGGVGETKKDLESLNRHIQAIVNRKCSLVKSHLKVDSITTLLDNSTPLPWIVVDDQDRYVGVIEEKRIIDYLQIKARRG